MDITTWLRGLSLAEDETVFLDNAIDIEVLPDLTDTDLEKLGVRLGHRKRMMRAIAALGEAAPAVASVPSPAAPRDVAERRQLTVMFVDLAGSTTLAAQMDPEDFRDLIAAYHRRTAEVVARFKGFVAKLMGDGVLVYFGYPEAAEGDVERAVRAGLAIVSDTALQAGRRRPAMRVGIETGMVIVGDLTGEGDARERGVVGETPNLAARLQGFAELDSVIIGPGTRRLLGTLFELRDLGAVEVRGLPDPVPAYCVLGLAEVEGRFEALQGSSPLNPLIGRDDDLQILLRRWEYAKAGRGQIVLLSGEAGIGKSRLTAALLTELSSEPHVRLRYFCSPHHVDSALFPFISQLERAAGFERGDLPDARLDKLDALLGQAGIAPEDAGLVASLLSLSDGGRYPALDLTPQRRRQRTLEVLTGQLEGLAAQHPVLMIFEDAHWADPSSIELLELAVSRTRQRSVLCVITFRPHYTPPWIGQAQVTSLILNRLTPDRTTELILKTAGDATIDPAMVDEIVARSDGVPLFVEELTKAILEVGGADASRVAAIMGAPANVPPALFASLMARLDRLQPGKEIAQIGAAIGREFTYELLTMVAARPESELGLALDQLIQAGLIFARGKPPEATYLFKHALVQDVAYGTLLRRPRQEQHARIADALEQQSPEILEAQPELCAYHLTRAGLAAKAVQYWLKAGERAAGKSANKEAIAHLRAGIDCLPEIAGSPEKLRTEIDLNSAMVAVLQVTAGYGADTVVNTLNHVLELCRQTGDASVLAPVLFQTWLFNHMRADYPTGGPLAAELLEVARKAEDPGAQMGARFANGLHHFATGELVASHRHFAEGAHIYQSLGSGYSSLRYAFITGAGDVAYTAWTNAMLGYPEQGLAASREAAEIIDRDQTSLHGGSWPGVVLIHRLDLPGLADGLRIRRSGGANGQRTGFRIPRASGTVARGAAGAMLEPDAAPPAEMRDGIRRYERFGSSQLPFLLTLVAEVSLARGDWDGASQALSEAQVWMAKSGERTVEAEGHRLAGELLAASSRGDAEPHFLRALEVARSQQARLFELRAARSLARLFRDQGRLEEARATLQPVYDWFTEGFGMPDLVEARGLLESLELVRPAA